MKFCRKCNQSKDSIYFGIDKQKKDGLNAYCKECIKIRSSHQRKNDPEGVKKYAIQYREENRSLLREKSKITYYIDWEKRREQSRKSYEKHKLSIAKKRAEKRRTAEGREKARKRIAEWRKKNKSRISEVVQDWKKRNPQKAAAHSLVLYAIRTGIIKKAEQCEECQKICTTQGHHIDYFKPLEVIWLCKDCHAKKHRTYR